MVPSGSFLADEAGAALLFVTHSWQLIDITYVMLDWPEQLQACPGSGEGDVNFPTL